MTLVEVALGSQADVGLRTDDDVVEHFNLE